jgi:RimJ/RimL family protein N-acetyltransferase
MSMVFETERLIVRRFRREDAADVVAFAGDPPVAAEIHNVPWQDPVKLLEYIEIQQGLALFAAQTCVDLAIERKSDRKAIGLLSFVSNGQRQGEIGWALGVEHRGSGYATEAVRGLISFAFEICGYHRVFAGTILTNEPSWKLMERVGMRKEAHFREAHVPAGPGGPWIDTVRYAVLASEWPHPPAR